MRFLGRDAIPHPPAGHGAQHLCRTPRLSAHPPGGSSSLLHVVLPPGHGGSGIFRILCINFLPSCLPAQGAGAGHPSAGATAHSSARRADPMPVLAAPEGGPPVLAASSSPQNLLREGEGGGEAWAPRLCSADARAGAGGRGGRKGGGRGGGLLTYWGLSDTGNRWDIYWALESD